jgi:uncharacterized protein (TIGR02266 family)
VAIENRRSGRRVYCGSTAEAEGAGKLVDGWVRELSQGGLFLHTEIELPRDSPISLRFALPGDSQPIEARGQVVYNHAYPIGDGGQGFGVQFVEVDPEGLRAIARYVSLGGTQAVAQA